MAQITLRDYLRETEDAISAGRTDDALQRCHRVLDRFPESLEAQRLLGEVYLAQDRLDEAQHAFDWVLTNDPENVIAYCDRALVCERRSDYDIALDCYQQAYELSRGNSQIRNEFNKLSVKAKLPGFMFSRAGLARLYMRGDLLTQSILEWEVVLASNTNRLDARAGMMEAYWRDGQYDQVEQTAQELLRDVPGCLKALLLLAHVVSAKNIQQARDLVHKAESFDPDLLMAQELFSDLFASRQAEPFLQLLKKPPVTLDPTTQPISQNGHTRTSDSGTSPSSQTGALPQRPTADPDIAIWTNHSIPGFQVPVTPAANTPAETAQPEKRPQEKAGTAPSEISAPSEKPRADATPREPQQDQAKHEHELSSTDLSGVELWKTEPDQTPAPSEHAPEGSGQTSQDDLPTPPAWLNMLTQSERKQLSGEADPPIADQPPAAATPGSTPSPAAPVPPTPQISNKQPEQEKQPAAKPTPIPPLADDNEEEESFFGPEWLKALGAEAMNGESRKEKAVRVPPTPQAAPEAPPATRQPAANEVTPPKQVPPTPQPPQEESQRYTSLDDLERSLRSQGFVDMAPNSLADIAKANNIPQENAVPVDKKEQPAPPEESGLPEALAQLGNFSAPSQPAQEDNIVLPEPSTRPLEIDDTTFGTGSGGSAEMPDWVTLLEQTVTAPPKTPQRSSPGREEPAAQHEPAPDQPLPMAQPGPVFMPAPDPAAAAPLPMQEQPSRAASGPVFEPSMVPPTPPGSTSASLTAPRTNPLLENELETTMRRPAVRLQQLQARAASQREPLGRNRPDRPQTRRGGDGQISHRERLLKGYQRQLAGDYDEAMLEYRLIIKGSPELLSEVISNLRALLKLAPKYIAGYRVLGDAYMKQGEYLQAMEAYNKALTMAKRAKQ